MPDIPLGPAREWQPVVTEQPMKVGNNSKVNWIKLKMENSGVKKIRRKYVISRYRFTLLFEKVGI